MRTPKRLSHAPARHWRSATATLAAASLTSLGVVAGSSSALASTTAHLETTLLGQIAVQGDVINAAGHGLAGAKVMLYAWPGSWQPTHRGERVPLRLVGQTLSAADGRYSVHISKPDAMKASALRDGTVNLQVSVAGSSAWNEFPTRITSTAAGQRLAAVPVRLTSRPGPATVNLHVSGSAWKKAAAAHPNDFCVTETSIYDKDYAKEWGAVDETYERYAGISATAKLSTGQSTTFSVGISGTGGAGSFTSSGRFSLGDSVTTQFLSFAGPSTQGYQANFTPAEYTQYLEPGNCFVRDYTQPRVQDDGDRKVGAGSVPSTPLANCDYQGGIASKTYSKTTAATITSGMTIAEIGFTATTQTGWSSTDTITYKNTSGGNWHTCGQSGDPATASAGRIVSGLPNGGGH